MTMVGPDGEEYPNSGHFRVVEPPERLSWHEEDIEHPMLQAVETTVEFVDLGGDRTKVVVTSRMVCADELVEMANAGWNSQFDRLERLLASSRRFVRVRVEPASGGPLPASACPRTSRGVPLIAIRVSNPLRAAT